MKGYQFRRQRPIEWYIADFVCLPLKLIIEVDGLSHENAIQQEKDKVRDKKLQSLGFTTLRFSAWTVLNRMEEVSMIISEWIEKNGNCPPPGPRQRER